MQIAATVTGSMRRHPARWGIVAVAVGGLLAFTLYWFAPWNLFFDRRVDEALPAAAGVVQDGMGESGEEGAPGEGADAMAGDASASEPVTLVSGEFRSLEHGTTGAALLIELPDGTRFLRLEGLETSNGPDLRVYLSSVPAQDDWYVYDDEEFVDLGPLKGNIGSSNYEIPADVDLSAFETAVVWCRRFSVGFGVAPLLDAAGA
jgi:hypothetical protein